MMSLTHAAGPETLIRRGSPAPDVAVSAAHEIKRKQTHSLAYQQQKREEEERLLKQQQERNPPMRRYRLSAEIARERQVVRGANKLPMALQHSTPGAKIEFCWPHGGENVFLCGSFCNWQQKIPLLKEGDVFKTTLTLPPGTYQFKFVVDGNYFYDVKKPTCTDSEGNTNNFVRI